MTYTYVTLAVSRRTHGEILHRLMSAGYEDQIRDDGTIDMHGLALVLEPEPTPDPNQRHGYPWDCDCHPSNS